LYTRRASISWSWFEDEILLSNCILPEALLFAYLTSHKSIYKKIALNAFDFLLLKAFNENTSHTRLATSSKFAKDKVSSENLTQSIDVTRLIQSLNTFYDVFKDETYLREMETAFTWFLGNNHLYYSVYDEEIERHTNAVNSSLNSTATVTIAADYTLARLIMENHFKKTASHKLSLHHKNRPVQVKHHNFQKTSLLTYLVKFSVLVMVVLIAIRKVFTPAKSLETALFKN
jgi:hypothetical protein